MVHKNTKTIASISVFVLFASLVLSIGFFSTIQQHRKALLNQENTIATEKAHKNALDELLHTVQKTEQQRTELASRIVRDDSVINFLSLFEAVGKEQGVVLTTDSLSTTPLNDMFETLQIHVSVKGSYTAIMRVLALFERLPYQSSVTAVTITNADQGKDGISWGGTFVLEITKFKKV